MGMTFTRLSVRPKISAVSERMENAPCVEVHTVIWPSGAHHAVEACGSM